MSFFFDSPIERCEREDCYVLLDQTQAACAREHGCSHPDCPLARWFARRQYDDDPDPASEDDGTPQRR